MGVICKHIGEAFVVGVVMVCSMHPLPVKRLFLMEIVTTRTTRNIATVNNCMQLDTQAEG